MERGDENEYILREREKLEDEERVWKVWMYLAEIVRKGEREIKWNIKSYPANERGSKGREKRRGRAMNGERKDGMDDRGMTHTQKEKIITKSEQIYYTLIIPTGVCRISS